MIKLKYFFLTLILILNIKVHAQTMNPILFLEKIVEECRLKLNNENDSFLYNKITKYMDFHEMSNWIVGKTIWNETQDQEKNEFINELKLIIRKTYKKKIYNYAESKILFYISKDQNITINKRIQLSSIIKYKNNNININYTLIKHKYSWLIFDIVIEGISILKGLKAQFSDNIKQEGLNKTIKKMKNINTS